MRRLARHLFTLCFLSVTTLPLCVGGCAAGDRGLAQRVELSRVAAATTVEEEERAYRELFQAVQKHNWSLAFAVFDRAGSRVPVDGTEWWKRVHTVELMVQGEKITHHVHRAENLCVLMAE